MNIEPLHKFEVDIVIPSVGRREDLFKLLDSIQTFCAESKDSIRSVTVSDDRFSEILGREIYERFHAVRYIRGPAKGPAANRNNGASFANANWILFLDDDCFLTTDVVAAYSFAVLHNAGCKVFEGAISAVGLRPSGDFVAPVNLSGGYLWSCNFMIARSLFIASDGFDERFPFACLEDYEFMVRLQSRGEAAIFVRLAEVHHPWRKISAREVHRRIASHAVYATISPILRAKWTPRFLIRSLYGVVLQYLRADTERIPVRRYGLVAYDIASHLLVFIIVQTPLRTVIGRRYVGLSRSQPISSWPR